MGKNKKFDPGITEKMIETHCHLDYLKSGSVQELVDLAQEKNVHHMITIAVEPSNLDEVFKISQDFAQVYCSQGVHPHEAKQFTKETAEQIRKNVRSSQKVVAIGEIGLDYHYDHSPRDIQREVFKQQLELAIELDLPAIIHTRDADEDTEIILQEYAPRMKKKGVIHSFTSGIELAKSCLGLGFCLGFNGIITFNSAKNVREVLEITPIDRILIETDSPFLTPVPYRGTENAPHFLPYVAHKVMEIKQDPEILATIYQNTLKLFNLSL